VERDDHRRSDEHTCTLVNLCCCRVRDNLLDSTIVRAEHYTYRTAV
jgi:hypothetical protein